MLTRTAGIIVAAFLLVQIFSTSLIAHPRGQSSPSLDVDIRDEKHSDGSTTFSATNPLIIPVWIQVSFPRFQNLTADVPLPFEAIIPAKSEAFHLFNVRPVTQTRGYSYQAQTISLYGSPRELAPSTHVYQLPFEHGTKYKLTQGFYGKNSHTGQNTFAIDFGMDIGTPVHAARGGRVFYVKEDSNLGGFSTRYAKFTNQIQIMHDDGSIGNYVHLMQNGALVTIGETVETGDLIGFSGNTGVSSGPHLHFDVRIPDKKTLQMQSVPFQFLTHDGIVETPEEGRYYYASHRGMPAFDVSFGSDLRNEDFADHQVPTEETKVGIREKKVDDTSVLFIFNGLQRAIQARITLILSNTRASTPRTIDLQIPAKTERFISILNPIPGAIRTGYTTRISYQ